MFWEKVCATVDGVFGAGLACENWAMFAGRGGWLKGAEKFSIGAVVILAARSNVNQCQTAIGSRPEMRLSPADKE